MRSIPDTIERLARYRAMPQPNSPSSALKKFKSPGKNPGNLSAWYQVPDDGQSAPALVVVLHGCAQTASGYDQGSGWSKLADDFGFAVLFPEQSRENNANLCFNWFVEADVVRDQGEVRSIREMIESMVSDHGVDPNRVYVTGLSAGGAMANALLAAYPEVFAGGAIIAGLPYGTASTVPQAFDRMRGHALPSASALQGILRSASTHKGPWPTVSVWHGTSDRMVDDANGRAIVDQWKGVHGVTEPVSDVAAGHEHLIWKDSSGRDAIELYRISGMGHGTPLDVSSGYGESGTYMLDIGISSTETIARNWGLTPSFERRQKQKRSAAAQIAQHDVGTSDFVRTTIENALRSAGLMK